MDPNMVEPRMHLEPGMHGAGGAAFFLIWLLLCIGMIIGWVIFLVAVWRGMKAHESLAESVKEIAKK